MIVIIPMLAALQVLGPVIGLALATLYGWRPWVCAAVGSALPMVLGVAVWVVFDDLATRARQGDEELRKKRIAEGWRMSRFGWIPPPPAHLRADGAVLKRQGSAASARDRGTSGDLEGGR